MRKNVIQVIEAFKLGKKKKVGPISTDGDCIYSYNMKIAEWLGSELWVYPHGHVTKTTSEHVRAVKSELAGYTR